MAGWCFREVACPIGSALSQAQKTGAGTWAGGWTPGDHETMFKEGNNEVSGQLLQEVQEKGVFSEYPPVTQVGGEFDEASPNDSQCQIERSQGVSSQVSDTCFEIGSPHACNRSWRFFFPRFVVFCKYSGTLR